MSKQAFIYLLRGLGDNTFSQGMDDLSKELVALHPQAHVAIFNWYDWHKVVADMKTKPAGSLFIIIGYSMGANEATGIAAASSLPIALLVCLDPTVWDSMSPLLGNVKRAVLFHDANPVNLVGHAELTAGEHFDPRNLVIHTTWDIHTEIDKDPAIMNVVVAEVKTALAA